MTAPPPTAPPWRRGLWTALQVGASLLVLGLLLADTDPDALTDVLARARPGWLALALVVKAVGLMLHEVRLWLAFNPPRPPARRTVAIGLAAGLLNTVLPMRAGDLAAIAMLRRECRVTVGAASAAVGVSSFLEAAVFGVTLGGVLLIGASRWEAVLGAAAHRDALQWVTLATLGGIAVAVGAVLVGRRLTGGPDEGDALHPLVIVRDALRQTSGSLGSPSRLAGHVALATIDVAATVGAFALLLPAVGLDVPLPLLAAAGVLAISSVASVVLPPTYAAGPAAASVAVLAVFGVDQAGALAYAAGYWLVSQVPAALLGLPCLLRRPAR